MIHIFQQRSKSLNTKISLNIIIIATLILGVFTIYEVISRSYSQYHQQEQLLKLTTNRLANVLWGPVYDYNINQVEKAVRYELLVSDIHAIIIYDAIDNSIIYGAYKNENKEIIDYSNTFNPNVYYAHEAIIAKQNEPLGKVVIYHSNIYLYQDIIYDSIIRLFIMLAILLTIVLALIRTLNKHIINPIESLAHSFHLIAGGNLDHPIHIKRQDEIGLLADNFSRMRDEIKKSLNDSQERMYEKSVQEERMRTTLESLEEAVFTCDNAGRIIHANNAAANLLGKTHDQLFAQSIEDLFHLHKEDHESSEVINFNQEFLQENDSNTTQQTVYLHVNDDFKTINISACPIHLPDLEQAGFVIVLRDITNEQMLESELRQRQKLDSIGQLAGGIAHDFNNMLAGILGAAETLDRKCDNDDLRKYISIISQAGQRAAELTTKLLHFSRKGKNINKVINVHDLIEETCVLLQRSIDKRITLERELHAQHPFISGDATQLQSALLNLGVNARDAMPEGGTLLFTTEEIEVSQDLSDNNPSGLDPGRYLCIGVADTGTGISMSIRERIFEPFFTTKEVGKGTGLGLPAVYGTIQEHDGMLSLNSSEGVGTTFLIYLPLETEISAEQPKTKQHSSHEGNGLILIAEDEELLGILLQETLEEAGYHCLRARDGQECMDLFHQAANKIDLVILDMIMPNLDGSQCFRQIHDKNPHVPVIICSGYTSDHKIDVLLDEGLKTFISKPYNLSALLKQVATYINDS